jgi:hypothetical protein
MVRSSGEPSAVSWFVLPRNARSDTSNDLELLEPTTGVICSAAAAAAATQLLEHDGAAADTASGTCRESGLDALGDGVVDVAAALPATGPPTMFTDACAMYARIWSCDHPVRALMKENSCTTRSEKSGGSSGAATDVGIRSGASGGTRDTGSPLAAVCVRWGDG